MKVMIFTVNIGGGHTSCAKSIAEYLKATGNEIEIVDTLNAISPFVESAVNKSYLGIIGGAREAYKDIYSMLEVKESNKKKYSLMNLSYIMLSSSIQPKIKAYAPDAIISTHVMPSQMVGTIRANDAVIKKIPSYGIITDFTIHPFWQDIEELDYFVTADEDLRFEAMRKGISEEKLLPFGIPIRQGFSEETDKVQARNTLGLDENKPTILLMGGALGLGGLEDIVKALLSLNEDIQIICVCANNEDAKKKIESMKQDNILTLGYTNEIPKIMRASDILITKPGGLTISEALSMELPMIFVDPLPGQEEMNMEYITNKGCAMSCSTMSRIGDDVNILLSNKKLYHSMKRNISHLRKPNALNDLCSYVQNNTHTK